MPHLPEAQTSAERAERALIGSLLTSDEIADLLFERLKVPEVFSHSRLRQVFTAMRALHQVGSPLTATNVIAECERQRFPSKDLPFLLTECMDYASPQPLLDFGDHIQILEDAYFGTVLRERARSVRSKDAAIECAEAIIELASRGSEKTQCTLADVIPVLLERQEEIESGRRREGLGWGIDELDEYCLIQPGKLYTLGGLKGAGKTLFLLHAIAHNLFSAPPVPCLFFSLEMSRDQLGKRMITSRADVNSLVFPSRYLGERKEKILRASEECKGLPLVIDDAPQLTPSDIFARTRAWKHSHRIREGIVAVDFLQLLDLERERGQTEASALKRAAYVLAQMAKVLNVAVLATAQLRNEAEGQEPRIGHLEGSGGIAQASEAVLLLDLVSRRDREAAREETHLKRFNVWIEKQRDGESGVKVECLADLRLGKFYGAASGRDDADYAAGQEDLGGIWNERENETVHAN